MGLGLGISVDWASLVPYYAQVASAFKARVEADGGTVESMSCLKADLKVLTSKLAPDLLLNDYDGAAAAYSLRLLDKSYSGSAVRVRRASDNAEQDIAFANNELDTATLETFASGTDAFVTTWYDQSGNANNATQTTASNQPKIVSSGSTILENGKACVQWNGGTEYLVSSFGTTYSQPNTIFVTANKTIHNGYLFDGLNGSKRHAQGNNNWLYAGAVLGDAYPNSFLGSQVLFTSNWNSTSSSAYINSVLTNSGNTGTMGIDGLSLGRFYQLSTAALTGNIQEFILYPSDESSNRTGIETNINDFYSIY